MSQEIEKPPTSFPLLVNKLKNHKKILLKAIEENDEEFIEYLKETIHNIESSMALGEKYDVPF